MNRTALAEAIRGAGGGKGGGSQRSPVESPDSLRSIAYARVLDLVSEGEIYGFADQANPLSCVYFNETPVANADGSRNFKNFHIESRVGTQTQDPIEGFGGVESEMGIGVRLEFGTPWTRAFTNINVTAIRVRLSLPALSKTSTENGDTYGSRVDYRIELATDGGSFVEMLKATFNGKASNKYERSHRIELPPATTGWTLRVSRQTPESTSQTLQNQTYVESVAEIIDAKLRMPMSAYIGLIVDAEQFNAIPSRAYRLRGRIIKIPSNYNPTTRAYTGIWDGTFQTAYSNNPAWVFYDMATNPRYGLGHLISADLIDKWSLYKIAQYCDELVPDGFGGMEPRFVSNVYLQSQDDAYRVMQNLASVFRGIMYAAGGTIMSVGDMPEDPVYTYTPANVIDGKFSYSGSGRKVRHTVALVSWNDLGDFGRAKIEYIDDPEGIARYGIQQTEIVAFGCTSRGQARRYGKYLLTTERFEDNLVNFGVGLDGTVVAPGKIAMIADPMRAGRRTGGRIKTGTLNSVTVDSLPIVQIGNDITVSVVGGGIETRQVTGMVGSKLNVTPNFSSVPLPQSVWIIEASDLKAQRFRILGVTEKDEGKGHDIVAIKHVEGKFDFVEQGILIEEAPISQGASRVVFAPSNIMMTHRDVADTNSTQKIVTLTWSPVAEAQTYNVMYRLSNGSWIDVGNTTSPSIDIQSLPPGVFEVQVSAISSAGVRSLPGYAGPFDIDPNIKPPGFVLQLNQDIADALLTAQNAAAAADGAIVSFWTPTAPIIGVAEGNAKDGDIWFDTDDGNKIYRVVSGAWTLAADDEIALAIQAATDAQATADGKVKLFVGATAPTDPPDDFQLNDLWFDTVRKGTYRFNGVDWNNPVADITLDQLGGNGVNFLAYDHTVFLGELPVLSAFNGATLGSVSYDGAVSAVMGGALKAVTQSTNVAEGIHFGTGVTDYNTPIAPGDYIMSFWAKANVAGHSVRIGGRYNTAVYFNTTTHSLTTALQRYSARITVPAGANSFAPYLWTNVSGVAGRTVHVCGMMLEPAIGNANLASLFTPGNPYGIAITAIQAAAAAQDTADGKIDSFFQVTMPAGGSLGDLWFDTDDGNKQYRHNGTTFVLAQDTAIGDAILAAAGAQATADGKIKTFYQIAAPTAEGIGDLWVDTDDKNKLHRWSGASWVEIRDVGIQDALDSLTGGGNLVPNSDFEEVTGSGNASYPSTGYSLSQNIANVFSYGVDAISSYFFIPNVHVMVIKNDHGVPLAPGQYFQLNVGDASTGGPIPVEAGKSYIFSAYLASHRCVAGFYVRFYDAAGAIIAAGNANTTFVARTLGNQRLDSYSRVHLKATAPALAVRAAMWIRWTGDASYTGVDSYGAVTRPMIEEARPAQVNPSPWAPSASGIMTKTLVALNNAAIAQATADGKITLFRQAAAPTTGMAEGDIWIDTDDGKQYVRVGSSWVYDENDTLGQALDQAISAQATADGKAATFYSTTTPTAEGEGDLWVNPTTKVVNRWNGSAWVDALTGLASGQTSDGVLKGLSQGANLIPNPTFVNNIVGVPDNTLRVVGDWLADNWFLSNKAASCDVVREVGGGYVGQPRLRMRTNTSWTTSAGYTTLAGFYSEKFDVTEGRKYKWEALLRHARNAAPPAGCNWIVRFGIQWYDSAGAGITNPYVDWSDSTGDFQQSDTEVAPAGAVKAALWAAYYFRNNSGATVNTGASLWGDVRIMKTSLVEVMNLDTEVEDGTNYGRYGVEDGYTYLGKRRFGLRIPGSNHRIGDQRNLPQSNTTAYGSVRTATALTATSAGAVSVNAHTVRYGAASVSYNAVSNAITGLAQGTTYVIYCVDEAYAGGTRTWLAGTDPAAVMNLGDGIVVAGQIKIPTSGSSSGGGSGTGGPEDWCVDYDTLLPDGRFLRDLIPGVDKALCVNVCTGEMEMVTLRAMGLGQEDCYRVTTDSLVSIVQSRSTPMDMRDGSTCTTEHLFGKQVLTLVDGKADWRLVADLQYLGKRMVLKPDFGNKMFFAGESERATIATHNAIHKP